MSCICSSDAHGGHPSSGWCPLPLKSRTSICFQFIQGIASKPRYSKNPLPALKCLSPLLMLRAGIGQHLHAANRLLDKN
jgi:hypothetical protein